MNSATASFAASAGKVRVPPAGSRTVGQALEDGSIGSDMFTQSNKSPHDKDAHVDRPFAMENLEAVNLPIEPRESN